MNDRGQVLAEFAVASLAAIAILLGIVDVARAVYTYHLVADDARLATRYAVVNGVASCAGGSPDPLQSYVSSQSWGMAPEKLTVTTTCPGGNTGCSSLAAPYDGSGCLVTVTVAYSFSFLTPLISILVLPMSSRAQMVISR